MTDPCAHHKTVLANLSRLGTLTRADLKRIHADLTRQCCAWPRETRT